MSACAPCPASLASRCAAHAPLYVMLGMIATMAVCLFPLAQAGTPGTADGIVFLIARGALHPARMAWRPGPQQASAGFEGTHRDQTPASAWRRPAQRGPTSRRCRPGRPRWRRRPAPQAVALCPAACCPLPSPATSAPANAAMPRRSRKPSTWPSMRPAALAPACACAS